MNRSPASPNMRFPGSTYMDAEHRMTVRHSVIPLALALFAAACSDNIGPLPTALPTSFDYVAADSTSLHVLDRKSTRLNSSHPSISYAVFCLKKKKKIYFVKQYIY